MLLPPPLLSLLVQHDTLLPLLRWREDRFASRQRESERILVRICVEQTSAQERPKVRRLTQCGPVVREMLEAFAFVSVSVRREQGCAGRARVDPVGRVQVG